MKKIIQKYWMIIIPVIIIASTVLFYCFRIGFYLLDNTKENDLYSKYAQFGDYFGGIINPILAFINIGLIAYYQKSDIRKQSEIDNIFKMIALQESIRNSIIVNYKGRRHEGLNAFLFINAEVETIYKAKYKTLMLPIIEKLNLSYTYIFENKFRKQELGHYYRNLYQIYKMIYESIILSPDEKLKYAKIVRAQLSHLELKFLFLNCISDYGVNFQKYVGEYDLLEWFSESDFHEMDKSILKTTEITDEIKKWGKS